MAGFQEILTDKFYDKTERDSNGYKYYIIPKGSIIYRGDSQLYLENRKTDFIRGQQLFYYDPKQKNPLFFGKEFGVASKYGIVFEFEVTNEYKLLAIDDHETIQNLYNRVSGNQRLRDVLDFNYGRETGIRLTDMDDDKVLCKWLCDNGFEGYAANQMPSTKEGTIMIHRELMICDPTNLEFIKVYTQGKDVENLLYEHKMRKISTEQRKSRSDMKKNKSPYSIFNKFRQDDSDNDNHDMDVTLNTSLNTSIFPSDSPQKPYTTVKKGKRLSFMDMDDENTNFNTPIKSSKSFIYDSPNTNKTAKSLFSDDFDGGRKKKTRKHKKTKKYKKRGNKKRTRKNRKH